MDKDLRKPIMEILKERRAMVWIDLVNMFPEDAIDIELPVAISYLREYGYIDWEDVYSEEEYILTWVKDFEDYKSV